MKLGIQQIGINYSTTVTIKIIIKRTFDKKNLVLKVFKKICKTKFLGWKAVLPG